jgi:hypothetical protein
MQFDVSSTTSETEPAQLGITGKAALGGTFILQPESGFTPAKGITLYLLDYASKSGSFGSIV